MTKHYSRGGVHFLQIERDGDGLVEFTVDRRKERLSIKINPVNFNGLMRSLLSACGRSVPSNLDNHLGADMSSDQEDRFAAALTRAGVHYRRSPTTKLDRRQDGNWKFCYPDFVIKGAWVIVFFDGCYFHNCPEHFPTTGRRPRNDAAITASLVRNGWHVIRIWEHEDFDEAAARVAEEIRARRALNAPQPAFVEAELEESPTLAAPPSPWSDSDWADFLCPA